MKHTPTISEIIPELNKICEQYGLEKKSVVHRHTPAGEHGYLRAFEIWKESHGIVRQKRKDSSSIVLATRIINQQKKLN